MKKKRKLNIGIIVPQFPSYTETFFVNKIMGLYNREHEIILFYGSPNKKRFKSDLFRNTNVKTVMLGFDRSPLNLTSRLFSNFFIIIQSIHFSFSTFKKRLLNNLNLRIFKNHHCDIYHFGYSGMAISYRQILDFLPGKTIISCLGTAENVKAIADETRMEKLKEIFSKVNKIHCVSENMAATIINYGAPSEKIFINRPAVNTSFYENNKEHAANEQIRIFSAGRLVFQKGFVIGLFAIRALKEKFSGFKWFIAGDGPKEEEISAHIHMMGLSGYVELTGKKDVHEMHSSYQEADIFFLPSVSEGLANVVLEAMSMKLPVVSSTAGGMNEVIEHDINGLLSNNFDYMQMADQLLELCLDKTKRNRLGNNARETVVKNFDLKRYIDVFENEYYKILEADD